MQGANPRILEVRGAPVTLNAPDSDRAVYGISVAADLVGMGVQNLRLDEARGLLEPERTSGGTRRYSANDLDRLRRIADLLEAGLNLAGIGVVLALEGENARLREEQEVPPWPTVAAFGPRTWPRIPRAPNRRSVSAGQKPDEVAVNLPAWHTPAG